jgi:hypothetical protein
MGDEKDKKRVKKNKSGQLLPYAHFFPGIPTGYPSIKRLNIENISAY